MFKIVRFPSSLESFFEPFRESFLWQQFDYFRWLVLLTGFAWGRRNIANLCRHLDPRKMAHRSRFNNFMLVGRWEPEKLLRQKADEILAMLDPHEGDVIEMILDDSKKQKRGKHMDAVGWIHDPVTGRKIRGHQYVKATLRFRGHSIPLGIRLYVKRDDCPDLDVEFRKTTQLAADLIASFDPPEGVKVRVLFDIYYLCPTVVKACRRKRFRFVSALKSNRNLFKGGRKLKAGTYGKNLFARRRKTKMILCKGDRASRYAYVDAGWMNVSALGRLHVVFSRKSGGKRILGLVSDDSRLSARGMVTAYDGRWSIEVFFKDSKQLLGLGQYQNRSYGAAVTHLHLVCFAYALLTHIAITREGEKGKRKADAADRSTATLQNELRRIVWDDLAEHLKALPSGDAVIQELDQLLIAA